MQMSFLLTFYWRRKFNDKFSIRPCWYNQRKFVANANANYNIKANGPHVRWLSDIPCSMIDKITIHPTAHWMWFNPNDLTFSAPFVIYLKVKQKRNFRILFLFLLHLCSAINYFKIRIYYLNLNFCLIKNTHNLYHISLLDLKMFIRY